MIYSEYRFKINPYDFELTGNGDNGATMGSVLSLVGPVNSREQENVTAQNHMKGYIALDLIVNRGTVICTLAQVTAFAFF